MKRRLISFKLYLIACAAMILFCACQAGGEQTAGNDAETSPEEASIGKAIELDPFLTVLRTAKGNMLLTEEEIDLNTKTAQIEFKDMGAGIRCKIKYVEIKGERYFFASDPAENEDHCLIFDTKNKPYFFLQTFRPAFGSVFLVDKKTLKVSKLIPDVLDGVSREETYNDMKADIEEYPDAFEWISGWIQYEFFDEESERLFFFAPLLEERFSMWSIEVTTKATKFVTHALTDYYTPYFLGSYNKYAMADKENLLVLEDKIYNINLNTHMKNTVKIPPEAKYLLEYSHPYAIFTTLDDNIIKYNFETQKGEEFAIPNQENSIRTGILSKDRRYIVCSSGYRDGGVIVIDAETNKKSIFLNDKSVVEYFWTEDDNLMAIVCENYDDEHRHLIYKLLP